MCLSGVSIIFKVFLNNSEALLNLSSQLFLFLKLLVFASFFFQVDLYLRLKNNNTHPIEKVPLQSRVSVLRTILRATNCKSLV